MNYMNRKLFKQRPARDKLNKMGGIMASSQSLMESVQKFNLGGSVDPYFGRMTQQNLPAIRPGSVAARVGQVPSQIMDFIGRANRESGIGQIMQRNEMARAGITPQDLSRVQAATQANRAADTTEQRISAGQIPTMRGPTAEQAQMGQNLNMFESMVEAGLNPTMRGPTADDIRDYADRRTAGETKTLRGPTAADAAEAQRIESDRLAGDILGDYSLISAAESDDPEVQAKVGAQVANNVKTALEDQSASDEEKNETALEFLGLKDPGEKLSRKEQIEKNKEFYREVFGVDPEEDKKIDGYNLAMMGFMIASGDSPNALQNIAQGAAQGVKGFMRTAEKRQSRDDKLTQLAVADYQSQVKSEAAREQFRLNYNLKVQELLDKRDQAKTKAQKDRFNAYLGAMDDTASALAFIQLDKANINIDTEEGFKKFNTVRKGIIAQNPDLASNDSPFRDLRDPKEVIINYLADYDSADRQGKIQMNKEVAAYLKTQGIDKGYKDITDLDRERYARGRVSRVYGDTPAPAPESVSAPGEIQNFPALPSDKNALQDGQTYNTPQGPATWNASEETLTLVE